MTFNQLFENYQKIYGNQHDAIFFAIVFKLSKSTKDPTNFISNRNNEIDFKQKEYDKMIKQYFVKKMPLAHIVGSTTFCGLQFQVSKKVLAPRDVTEQMVRDFIAAHKNDTYLNVVDLCCGCGCIGISIKKHLPQADVVCIDKYWQPLFDTNANGIKNKTPLTIDKYDAIDYLNSKGRLDILISNPPYVNAKNFKDKHMYKYESKKALIAPDNGLYFYKEYFKWLDKHTFKEAWMEYGYDQRQALKDLLAQYPSLDYVMSEDKQYLIVKPK